MKNIAGFIATAKTKVTLAKSIIEYAYAIADIGKFAIERFEKINKTENQE